MKTTIIFTILTFSRNKLAKYLVSSQKLKYFLIVLSEFQWVTLMVVILFIKRNQIFRVLSQDLLHTAQKYVIFGRFVVNTIYNYEVKKVQLKLIKPKAGMQKLSIYLNAHFRQIEKIATRHTSNTLDFFVPVTLKTSSRCSEEKYVSYILSNVLIMRFYLSIPRQQQGHC